jgi:hypothetical protein
MSSQTPSAAPIPIIIGIGDIINRSLAVSDATEPLKLIIAAIQAAIQDTGAPQSAQADLTAAIDSVSIVRPWTWPYADLPGLVAQNLGVNPSYKELSPHGGNQPAKLVDEAAKRVVLGKAKVAVVAGGEALASCKGSKFHGWEEC